MTRLLRLIDGICLTAAWLAALLLLALFLMGLAEILARNLFGISFPVTVEYSGYLVASILLLGSGWTLRQGGHIRVPVLRDKLPPDLCWALDLAASLIGLGIAGVFAYALIDYTLGTAALGERSYYPSATPLVYPQALLCLGPLVLSLALLARVIRLLRREQPEANA